MRIPIVVHHRHVHLSKKDMDALFGPKMTPLSDLGHKGQHAYQETVDVVGERGVLERVRVLGPSRDETQLELSPVEAIALGLDAPVRSSGDLARAATVKLKGPKGEVRRRCAIIPVRHLHADLADATRLGVSHNDVVTLEVDGHRRIEQVLVRVHPTFALECHLSPDEAAELWVHTGDTAHLAKPG
ncbi:hypothetical protein A2856_02350 [Candidatus Uhrbacteria bacterium RIFCSPHIGHO2_01_FULL_63_20]|uniref:Phosphate propanoyltransferase n=1 Tax=Candidatus Uhrbacteria bacterium RIFCSPHIGHO2_01_FULL_63_20 TaxID=1802385 RepID=A0A1F7TKK7_9BACT|nr:MAG: hypothetical protein A2856_02350 [Candidatus Uhrbacteria bacterium RIFCSPHIGHO2_01_FULL_63_20]